MKHKHINQFGFATLTMIAIVLLMMTVLAVVGTKTAVTEQKVAANEYRAKQAFEAAEAGLEFGQVYADQNRATLLLDTNNNGYIDSYSSAYTSNVSLANSTSYSLIFTNPIANDFNMIEITSIGTSPDGTVSRTVRQLFASYTLFSNGPFATLVSKGAVDFSGDLTITNTTSPTTIWSGGGVSLTGSAETDAGNGNGSSSGNIGTDIQQNDTNLSTLTDDAFFETFVGTTRAVARETANLVYTNNTNTNYSSLLDGVQGKLIWIEQTAGNAVLNGGTIGSVDFPVVLIINGNLSVSGNVMIYGAIYIANNFTNNGAGTVQVNGAMIVEGTTTATGTPDVTYNPTIFDNINEKLGSFVKVPGSWRDI